MAVKNMFLKCPKSGGAEAPPSHYGSAASVYKHCMIEDKTAVLIE
jgi:hypothetical protein